MGTFPSASDSTIFVGPSLAVAPGSGERSGFLFGADATVTAALAWASVGARVQPGEHWNVYPYGETGIWLLVNFGIGYSFGLGPEIPTNNWHWFVGVPIPVSEVFDENSAFFIEPYYRPTMAIDDPAPTLHERGLLAKWGPKM